MGEILKVLLGNASDHGTGPVRLVARPMERSVAIDVSDEGPGPTDAEHVFIRGAGQGHGIGLALARSLAEADGGRLDLTAHGQGVTRFTLLLPAEEPVGLENERSR